MITLFEDYNKKVIKMLKKIYLFIELIVLKNDELEYNDEKNYIIVHGTNKNVFVDSFVFNKHGQFWSEKDKYQTLEKYLYYVMDPYFKDKYIMSDIPRNIKHSKVNFLELTNEIIDSINFSKKDYEEFEDAERFGL